MKGAEDGVRLALLCADVAELIDRVQAGMVDRLDARRFEGRAAELPRSRPKGLISRVKWTASAPISFARLGDLALGLAVADHQPGAPVAKLRVELRQALQEKLGARPGLVAAVEQAVVEAEDRNDALMAVEGRAQRGMVADPKIATKPNDAGPASGHGMKLPSETCH